MSEKDKPVIDTENKTTTTLEITAEKKAKIMMRRRNMISKGKLYLAPEDQDPNYVYRYVNHSDELSGVNDKIELGYEIVRDKTLTGKEGISSTSGLGGAVTKQVGRGTLGVLMRVHKDLYNDGLKVKSDIVDQTEQSIKNPDGLDSKTTFTKTLDNSID